MVNTPLVVPAASGQAGAIDLCSGALGAGGREEPALVHSADVCDFQEEWMHGVDKKINFHWGTIQVLLMTPGALETLFFIILCGTL